MKLKIVPFYALNFAEFSKTTQPLLRALKHKFCLGAFYYSNFLEIKRGVIIFKDRKDLWLWEWAYKIQQEKLHLKVLLTYSYLQERG